MPDWKFHVGVAKEIFDKLGYKQGFGLFGLGSIMPDCPWMPKEESIGDGHRMRGHYADVTDDSPISIARYDTYVIDNAVNIADHLLYQGILTHLVLDRNINLLWKTIVKKVGFNRFQLPEKLLREEVSGSDCLGVKWRSTEAYSSVKYRSIHSDILPLNNIPLDICYKYYLTEDNINLMKLNITKILDRQEESTYISDIMSSSYDSIVEQTVMECVSIIVRLQHLRGLHIL